MARSPSAALTRRAHRKTPIGLRGCATSAAANHRPRRRICKCQGPVMHSTGPPHGSGKGCRAEPPPLCPTAVLSRTSPRRDASTKKCVRRIAPPASPAGALRALSLLSEGGAVGRPQGLPDGKEIDVLPTPAGQVIGSAAPRPPGFASKATLQVGTYRRDATTSYASPVCSAESGQKREPQASRAGFHRPTDPSCPSD